MSFTTFVYLVVAGSVAFLCYYALVWLPRQIRRDYRQGLQALARVVEIREQHTTGSAALRARYARAIAQKLGIPVGAAQDIELAALLQEIGKVSTPYSILNKDGPLSADEAEVLKLHPVIGQRMVAKVPSLARLAPLIRHHHENWNGSGYPDRLKGEEILLASRILHIVGDFVELLRGQDINIPSARLQALQELTLQQEGQYDPRLLKVFAQIIHDEAYSRIDPSYHERCA